MLVDNMLLIKNAEVVLGNQTKRGSVLIKGGKIESVDYVGEVPSGAEVVDADGAYLLPGFIDLHVHGGGGADFMDATPEAFEVAVKAHMQHGTTTIVPTAMTATESDLRDFILAYKSFKENSEFSEYAAGIHIEGPYFSCANSKSKGAQPAGLIRPIDLDEMQRLVDIYPGAIVRWDAAPEVENYDRFAEFCKKNGILAAVAHTSATTDEAERAFDAGFSHVTHFYNAVTTYHKEDQKVLDGAVEATYLKDDVTVELICDGCHIPKGVLRLALKLKGAEKVSGITDAMRIAGTDMPGGKLGSLKNGTDVLVDDGVAKLLDLSSFAGSICTMDRALRVLCKDYEIPIETAAIMLSLAPAKTLGLDNKKGVIKEGFDADLVIANPDYSIKSVIKSGKVVK